MVAHDGSRRIHLVGAFSAKSVTSVEVRSPSAMRYPTRALARSPSYPSRSEWCCSPLPTQDQRRGEPPSTACTSTIRLLISYLAVITLRGEESRCHGTRVLTWSGSHVPKACTQAATPCVAQHAGAESKPMGGKDARYCPYTVNEPPRGE